MAILVTGASGFLGGALVQDLRRAGRAVLATGRDPNLCAARGALALDLAASDAEGRLLAAADAAGVTAIVHAAALTAPWGRDRDFWRSNVTATQTVLAVAARLGVARIVHISTPTVYFRFADQIALPEDSPLPPPVNAYAATKARAETMALTAGALVLRPRGIYGSGDRALLPRLVRAMAAGPLPLMRQGRAGTDLTHVDDVIAAIHAALATPGAGGRIYNISGGVALPIRRVVEQVAARAAQPLRWRPVPVPVVMSAARLMEWRAALTGREPRITRYGAGLFAFTQTLDISRAARDLGWQPRIGLDEGLRRTFAEGR